MRQLSFSFPTSGLNQDEGCASPGEAPALPHARCRVAETLAADQDVRKRLRVRP